MAYRKYTKEQKQEFEDLLLRIKSDVSIIEYAQILGFTPVRVGKKYTLKEHNSVIIDPEENFFWRNAYKGDPHWCGIPGLCSQLNGLCLKPKRKKKKPLLNSLCRSQQKTTGQHTLI